MKLTLITVCYNSASLLPTALASVLAQTSKEYEYLIIDGNSKDDTCELLKAWEPKFEGRMKWISEPDRGLYDAINKGIVRAAGEAIALLHADDMLNAPDIIAQWIHAFKAAPDIDAIYGDVRFIAQHATDLKSPTTRYYSGDFWKPWMLRWGLIPPHPSIVIRKKHFLALGGYLPQTFKIAADHELLVRYFYRAHLKTRYIPLCTTAMRLGGLSTQGIKSKILLNREIVHANRMNGLWCILPMMAFKYIYKCRELILPHLRKFS